MAQDIDWQRVEDYIVQRAHETINGMLVELKEEIDNNTPIDTETLIKNTKIRPAEVSGNRISGSVYNETEYGKFVEYGVQGKTYNYHKSKRIFYVGVGARMFTRAYDKLKAGFIKRFKKQFNL